MSAPPHASVRSFRGLRPALWWRAFAGFYRPWEGAAADLDPVAKFLYAARSVILVISAQAAVIAGLLAATGRRFDLVSFLLVVLGFVTAHAISNLSNDYFGFRRGHDTPDSPRMRYTVHPLASGLLTRGALLTGLASLVAIGGYFVIAGQLSAAAFLASVPYGLGVMSILVGKHIDQAGFDLSRGQRTLPVILGDRRARALNRGVVIAMYLIVVRLFGLKQITPSRGARWPSPA